MLNHYYLIKKLLTDKVATEELTENDEFNNLFDTPSSTIELYDDRVLTIRDYSKTIWIENLVNISGKDITSLMTQRDYILNKLSNKIYAETLIGNKHPFKDVLEGLLEVTLTHIENYEKAEKLLTGKRIVSVMIDGNNHNITKDEKHVCIQTEIEDNMITLEQCQKTVENIRKLGHEPKRLKFYMSIYTETEGNECGDFPEECLLDRIINYDVEGNSLMVWEKGEPILKNVNGVIYDDKITLADGYL